MRQNTSAYVNIRRHMLAYVSIRQHTVLSANKSVLSANKKPNYYYYSSSIEV
jgi:hypothetical protein